MNSIITELLQKIHYYYPIGVPQIYLEYSGYKSLQEKIEKKIDQITEGEKTDWSSLVDELNNTFGKDMVFDYSFYQFPSYLAVFEFMRSKDEEKEFKQTIVLNISLLTNHYTVFIEDFYKYIGYDCESYGINYFPSFKIIYYKATKNKSYLNFIDSLKVVVQRHFQKHTFIEHSLLFNNTVEGGVIYGRMLEYSSEIKYSIYEYLFFNNINRKEMIVLE